MLSKKTTFCRNYLLLSIFLTTACTTAPSTDLTLNSIPTPCQIGGESKLFTDHTGRSYLSWVEYMNDSTDALVFVTLEDMRWSDPKTIATGTDWFVNWADFPSIAVFQDNAGSNLAAHWLQKSASGTYDYDIRIAQSQDRGKTWGTSFVPHQDSIAAEHGFVSMLPYSEDRLFLAWLDGRYTKQEGGAMTLRTAEIDRNGQIYEAAELDARVCDCCQTSAAITAAGPIVAYRDRSESEIRDIAVVRKVDGNWTTPQTVAADQWQISGCPVNGPAIKANENTVALAWFSAQNDERQVKISFSTDAGEHFNTPIRVDEGNPEGRVDVLLWDEKAALVLWLERTEENAAIRLRQVNSDGTMSEPITIATTSYSRKSGFPHMTANGDNLIFAWTQIEGEDTRVRSAYMHWPH